MSARGTPLPGEKPTARHGTTWTWSRLGHLGLFRAAALTIGGWALIANLGRIGFPARGFDEPIYAVAAWRYIHGDTDRPPTGLPSNWDNFEHPPFAKYLFGIAQLFAGHPSIVADRVVAALCTLASAAVLAVWLATIAGRWVGLGAGALVALLPMSVADVAFRFGRYGYLDPVAELFAVSSVALAWFWFRRTGRAGWSFALATGACVGLAAASKENGFLGAVGPVLVGLLLAAHHRRAWATRLLQAVAATATSCLVFAATYLGFAHPIGAFRYILTYQQEHARLGHRVEFAGRVSIHPPGWAFLWFAQHGIGTTVAIMCLICVGAAILLRHDLLVLWCLAALAGPLLFHMVIAHVVLSFYWVMWMPAFLALVALGVAELVRLTENRLPRERDLPANGVRVSRGGRAVLSVAGVAVAGLCAVVFTGASLHDTYSMLTKPASVHRTTTYPAEVLDRSPLVYLRLGDRSGITAVDSAPDHHDGVYTDQPTLGAPGLLTGDPDPGVNFNGTTQFASVPGAAWMNVPDYSVLVWFKTTASGGYLISRDSYSRSKVWDLFIDASGRARCLTFRPSDGGGQAAVSTRRYNDGRRHMMACTKSGSTMRLYLDGRLVASAHYVSFERGSGTQGIDLARRGNGVRYFRGTLDEFAFFGSALSDADVSTLYSTGVLQRR